MTEGQESTRDMPESPGPKHLFGEGDLDLLVEALRLIPDLEFAVYLAKRACSRLQFPVVSHEQLRDVLEEDAITYQGRTVTFADMARYLPTEIFPIEGPDECLGKALIGLCWGATCHQSRTPG